MIMALRTFFILAMTVAILSPISAQKSKGEKILVTGIVTDLNGQPIKRAVLYIDSIKTFSRTNRKGVYKVWIRPETEHFMVYSSKHGMFGIPYDGRRELDFQFTNSFNDLTESDLEDMSFTITAPRKGTIDPSRFKEYATIFDLIREMFTGVEVKGESIVVRGGSSFAPEPPLYIVDGSYVPNIAFVNPVEIKSIELIKDGNAALYGARGSNGVILIRLKK